MTRADEHGDVEVRLLDGVRLFARGQEIGLRGDRQRALLARLALDRGTSIPRGVLLDNVWGEPSGGAGASALRVQVKRLRDHLEPHGMAEVIETTADGYRLSGAVSTDVAEVEKAVDEAAADRSEPAELCDRFARLNHLLRGRPLHGLEDHPFAMTAAQQLSRLQTRARTWEARVCLLDARADRAASITASMLEESPMDEGIAAIRMDALSMLGRNREALAVAHGLRSELASVGLVAGAEIDQREQRILNPAPSSSGPAVAGITGRRSETQRLLESLEGLADGVGTTVVISGPAGIGKSALADVAVEAALARAWPVITTGADEIERQRPFHLIHSTFSRRGEAAPRFLDPGHLLAEVTGADTPGGFDAEGARLSVITRLNTLLAENEGPLVVLAEDLHWADDSSLAVLRALSRAAPRHGVLLLLTGRSEGDWQRALGELPRADIDLGPLSDDEVRELAAGEVGGSLGPDLDAAVSAAGGNPLLIIEFLRGLAMEGRLVTEGDVVDSSGSGAPVNVQALAARRLRTLPDELVSVIETAAVLGRVSERDTLAQLCEIDPDLLPEMLQTAEQAGIVAFDGTRVSFRHDLFRDAVYEGIADGPRARLHRRIAQAFAATDRPIISIAAHALLSGPERDPQIVEWMREAAAAVVAVEPRSSIAFLDRALELSQDVDERFRLQHAKVEALTTAGELKQATELVDVLVRAGGPETVVLQIRYAGLLMAQARASEAREVLGGIDRETISDDQRARWGALTGLCAYAAFDQTAAREHAQQAIEDGKEAGDAIGLSMAHGLVGRCDVMSHRYRDGLGAGRLSAEYADADPTGGAHLYLPWYFVGMTLLDLDEHAAVGGALKRGRAASAEHHLHFSAPLYLTLETALAQRTGDLTRAFRAGVQALELEQHLGYTLVSAWLRALLSLTALEAGELALAETYCGEAERAQAAGSPQGAHVVALARAELLRTAGDHAAAFEVLDDHWRFFEAFSLHACKPFIAPALARAAVLVGDAPVVDAVRGEMEVLNERSTAPAHRATVDWVAGLVERDPTRIEAAQRAFDVIGRGRDASIAADDLASVRKSA